jgi:hypothetical protein
VCPDDGDKEERQQKHAHEHAVDQVVVETLRGPPASESKKQKSKKEEKKSQVNDHFSIVGSLLSLFTSSFHHGHPCRLLIHSPCFYLFLFFIPIFMLSNLEDLAGALDGGDDDGEAWGQQDDGGRALGGRRGTLHGKPDIGLAQRGGVVHTVARHARDVAALLP